jgi:Xaa-Pro aminopeptidase
LERLGPDEAILLFASSPAVRTGTSTYRYRPNSDLFWLTGWEQPEAVAVLRHGDKPFTLFVRPRDVHAEMWEGARPGPEGAMERFGADTAHPIHELEQHLPGLLTGVSRLHYAFGHNADRDAIVRTAIRKSINVGRKQGYWGPEHFSDHSVLLHELRLVKQHDEIDAMREAGRITALAHKAIMRGTRPGMHEYEVESMLLDVFRRNGSTGPGYTSIVAGGANATCLHYTDNNQPLNAGELILVDAGAEHSFYTADVTRTYPISGTFSAVQRAVYDHVLDAQMRAIEAVRVGATFSTIHDGVVRRLVEGLLDLGLLHGGVDERIEDGSYKKYYPHGTGHWLGLDVHDVGTYGRNGVNRPFVDGMVLTIEPGIYVPADDLDAHPDFRGIGIRIEDDILVSGDTPEVLTSDAPKHPKDIEAWIAAR